MSNHEHDYDWNEMRCIHCDCRPGGRVSKKPCGYPECHMASRVGVNCPTEGKHKIVFDGFGNAGWKVIVRSCEVHLAEELERVKTQNPVVTLEPWV